MFIKSIKHSIDASELLEELKFDLKHAKRFECNDPRYFEGVIAILEKYIEEIERIVKKWLTLSLF